MDLDHGREGTEPRDVLGSTARPRSADLSLGMWMSVSPAGGLGGVDCFQTVTGRAGAMSKAISKSAEAHRQGWGGGVVSCWGTGLSGLLEERGY